MRKFIICSLALGIVAIVSTTVIESGHKSITVSAIDSIDHAKANFGRWCVAGETGR